MAKFFQEWRWLASLVVAVLTLFLAIGWLDVVRGRQLTVIENNQQWVMRELTRIHERLSHLEQGRRP